MPQGVRPSDQVENNKTALRQRQNWLIKAASASKEIRLLLAPHSRERPVSHGEPGRAEQQKQQALNNNKNRARTNLGGSFGSPSSFRSRESPPAALLHTFSRHDARIRSNHAVIVPYAVETG